MSALWRTFCQLLYQQIWQLLVQPMMKISSIWRYFSLCQYDDISLYEYITNRNISMWFWYASVRDYSVLLELIFWFVWELPYQIVRRHYGDVKMGAIASQITSLTIVYSTVYSDADQKKTSKLRVTGLCAGNSPGTGEFPAQMASNAENVSIWWRHHGIVIICPGMDSAASR